MKLLALALVVAGCTPAAELELPDSGPPAADAGLVQWVEDGAYQADWGDGPAGAWLDCDGFELRDDSAALGWLGSDCHLPELVGTARGNCVIYPDGDRAWHLCPNVGGLFGELRQAGAVVMSFRARWLWP